MQPDTQSCRGEVLLRKRQQIRGLKAGLGMVTSSNVCFLLLAIQFALRKITEVSLICEDYLAEPSV